MNENKPTDRLERLRALLNEETPALLVTATANIRYLINRPTLFDPDFGGALFVSPRDAWLLVDGRYTAQAEAANLPCRVEEWSGTIWKSLSSAVAEARVKRIGFEPGYITVAQWRRIKDELTVELIPVSGLVEKLRLKKEPAEIDALASAARIADEVFLKIVERIKPGSTERELAADIEYWMRRGGAEAPSFDTIVASGPNSAFPHAGAGERRLQSGDLVKIDFGAVYGGFHSDMTRTVVLGRATEKQKQLYNEVAEAQTRALDGLAPGVTGQEVDALARDYFRSIGKVENFGHNLGHGVGLDVHEQPTLGPKSSMELEAGMVFTIEPGLYFPDFGGVRIEDMVVMREHGIQILTSSSKEMLEL